MSWKPLQVDPQDADDFILEDETFTASSNNQPSSSPGAPGASAGAHGATTTGPGGFKTKERTFQGSATLDEPVLTTLSRDLKSILSRLGGVLWPQSLAKLAKQQQQHLLQVASRSGINLGIDYNQLSSDLENDINSPVEIKPLEWDLWGPLIFILAFSLLLALQSPKTNSSNVFSSIFTISWISFSIISINIQLLGGSISFFPALSTIGYALFPLVLSALLSIFIKFSFIRFLLYLVFTAWSTYSVTVNLKVAGVFPGRVFLAVFPVGLVYATLGWLCVIT